MPEVTDENSLPIAEVKLEVLTVFEKAAPPTVALTGTETSMVKVQTPGLLPVPAITPKLVILNEVELPAVEVTVPPVHPLSVV